MIEADFEREYRINLVEELPRMSWRRFLILLEGLSHDSRLFTKMTSKKESTNENVRIIDDPDEGEAHFAKNFGL